MGSPYLSSDESIVLSTHNVIINTIPAEAILTNRRLVIFDRMHSQFRSQDIPFAAIETVTIGENSILDPVLSLSVATQDGTRHSLGIVFPQTAKTKRIIERDEWATKLKNYNVAAQQEHGLQPMDLTPPWVPGSSPDSPEGKMDDGKDSVDEKYRSPRPAPRKPRSGPPSKKRTVVMIAAAVIIIIAIAIGAYFLTPAFTGKTGLPSTPVMTPVATTPVTPLPTQVAVPVVSPSLSPAATTGVIPIQTTPPQNVNPSAGIWVHVQYAGIFSGSIGTPGSLDEKTGTGEQYYRIPSRNEAVTASFQKQDNSGMVMTVELYNDGELIKRGTTSTPQGSVDLYFDVQTVKSPTVTPTITP
jgi:hypothetical protein